MSHELTQRADGKFEFAFTGERSNIWHKHGQELTEGASEAEWVSASGMDWKIRQGVVRYAPGRPDESALARDMLSFDDQRVLFRSDTHAPLGVVSPKFKVVQPAEIFHFFRELVDGAGFKLNTAGTMFGGRRFWALAKIDQSVVISGQDEIEAYLMLVTSCDGTLSTIGKFLAERVVCHNTMTIGLKEKTAEVRVSHRTSFDANKMKDQLGMARQGFAAYIAAARKLASIKINNEDAQQFIAKLLTDAKATTRDNVESSAGFREIMKLFNGSAMGGTLISAEGTKWGLLNAVTEYVDHHSRAKSESHRISSAWLGKGDSLKTLAADMLMM